LLQPQFALSRTRVFGYDLLRLFPDSSFCAPCTVEAFSQLRTALRVLHLIPVDPRWSSSQLVSSLLGRHVLHCKPETDVCRGAFAQCHHQRHLTLCSPNHGVYHDVMLCSRVCRSSMAGVRMTSLASHGSPALIPCPFFMLFEKALPHFAEHQSSRQQRLRALPRLCGCASAAREQAR
jgi:hypothetical protein